MVEALGALILFIPSVALSTARLEDVTFRGEMAKRWARNQATEIRLLLTHIV